VTFKKVLDEIRIINLILFAVLHLPRHNHSTTTLPDFTVTTITTTTMGNYFTPPVPSRPAVPAGVTRICVSGFGASPNVGRAQKIAALIVKKHPTKYETWYYFSTFGFGDFLKTVILPEIPEDQKSKSGTKDKGKTIGEHTSAPFVWLETSSGDKKEYTAIGGRDMFCEWAEQKFPDDAEVKALTETTPGMSELFFDSAVPGGTYAKE
jgi:hypothetical protein